MLPTYCQDSINLESLSGLPGRTGGSFFGIADTIIEGQNLRISSNGGEGGDGQDGADGAKLNSSLKVYYSEKESLPGQGGKKGQGGLHGMVGLFFLNNFTISNIQISTVNGPDGKSGINGSIVERNAFHVWLLTFIKNSYKTCFKNIDDSLSKTLRLKMPAAIINVLMNDLYRKKLHSSMNDKPIGFSDFFVAVTEYRKYVIFNTLTGNFAYADLYEKLNNNLKLVKNLNTSNFVEEFFDLEDYHSLKLNKSTLSLMYMSLIQGITLYKSNLEPETTNDYKTVLFRLHDMISRKIGNLNDNFYDKPILKIDIYLKQCIEDGKKLRNMEVLDRLQEVSNEFKKEFEKEIEEAGKLIDHELKIYLEENIDDLNLEITKLIDEVDEMIKSKEESIENLKKTKRKLVDNLILRTIFTILQLILKGISFINPICAVIGTSISAGLSVVEPNVLEDDDATYTLIQLPEAATSSFQSSIETYNEGLKDDVSFIENKLNEIKSKKDELNLVGEEAQPLMDADNKIRETCISNSNPRACMLHILEDEESEWTNKSTTQGLKYEKSLKIMKIVSNSIDALQLGVESINKIAKDVSKLGEIDNMIEKEKNDIKQLEDFKKKIQEQLEPQIENIRKGMRVAPNGFAITSRALLEYQKFQMDDYLMGISSKLESLTKEFTVADNVKEIMTKVKNAMNAIIHMHTHIKDLRFKIKNADYFQNVASAPLQIDGIKDPKLLQALTKLEQVHYSNNIINDYNKLVIAMQRYTYPLTRQYSDFTTNPNTFFDNSLTIASVIVEKMKHLKSNLNKRRGHGRIIEHVSHSQFGNGGRFPPFYIWNNSMHSSAIEEIFYGKEVQLFANIFKVNDLSAVKFRDIGILFTTANYQMNEELKNELKQFTVILTHNGDSYYRCLDKVHLIKSGASDWAAEFLMSRRKRDAFDSDYVLSPFATWSLQLISISNENNNFTSLAKYVNEVNIELVGDGQFMLPNATICSNNLVNDYGEEVPFIA